MKIGFLITYFYPRSGGAESNCFYLAKELAKNHEVHVFTSGEADAEEVIGGIKVHRCREIFRIKYYLAYYPSLIKKLLAWNLDVLHIHGLGFWQHDSAIKKYKQKYPKTKIICTPHGPFMALKKYNLLGSMFKNIYTNFIIKNLASYNAVIQVNPYQRKWIEDEYKVSRDKIKFVPNGIPKEAFRKLNKVHLSSVNVKYNLSGKLIISYLGRIQKYKGLDQVIQVLPDLIKITPNMLFLAIGKDAGDKERLDKLAKELNVYNNIIFTGEVSEDEKLALLELSDIFVFPSEWEAFGIAMLEAMARGNAVVSSKTEGGQYLIEEGKNGFLYNYQDLTELKEKLAVLIKSDALRKKMQKANIKKAKSFLWPNIAKKLEEVYKN